MSGILGLRTHPSEAESRSIACSLQSFLSTIFRNQPPGVKTMREPQPGKGRAGEKLRPSAGVPLGCAAGKKAESKKGQTNDEAAEKAGHRKPIPARLPRRSERDLRRFKVRYNTGIGNIMRNWMSLMYSILILRMNLIKFIFDQFPDAHGNNRQLSQQILLECKVIYHMVRKAQHFSQDRALFMWGHLEKLIANRSLLRSYFDSARRKDSTSKDWKGMAARLELAQAEYEKVESAFAAMKAERSKREKTLTGKVRSLENLSRSKNEVLEQLMDQVVHLKKVELEASCQIINHLRTYRDLSMRKKELLNIKKELKHLKNERDLMVRDCSSRVKALKFGIVEKDNEIKAEKEERKKLKRALKQFGTVEGKAEYPCGDEAVA